MADILSEIKGAIRTEHVRRTKPGWCAPPVQNGKKMSGNNATFKKLTTRTIKLKNTANFKIITGAKSRSSSHKQPSEIIHGNVTP